MPERPSRRELIVRGAATTAAIAVPALAAAQDPAHPAEQPLAKPLTEDFRKLLAPALEANAKNGAERLKHRLAEGSEPCFAYRAEPKEVRRR